MLVVGQIQGLENGKAGKHPDVDCREQVAVQDQSLESGKAGKHPAVDSRDLVIEQGDLLILYQSWFLLQLLQMY